MTLEAASLSQRERRSDDDRRRGGDRRAAVGPMSVGADATAAARLEIYKLAVEMADRVSARRAVANSFFLTINTGLAALLGGGSLRWYVAVAGIVFAAAWWSLLYSYRQLSAAKFAVINDIERTLPLSPFTDEWRILTATGPTPDSRRARMTRYRQLGAVERTVPAAFALIYAAELVRQIAG